MITLTNWNLYLIELTNGNMVIARYAEKAPLFDFSKPGFDCGEYMVDLSEVSRVIRPVDEDELDIINTVQALMNMVTCKPLVPA